MKSENNKHNKIIGVSIGIALVLLIIIASTYALWQVTKTQKDKNSMIAACLDLDLNKTGEGSVINLENSWPMNAVDAVKELTGYTFTVTNNCDTPISYVIGLESLEDERLASLSASAVALAIDDDVLGTFNSLNDIEGPDTYILSKEIKTAEIKGKETNTHLLKIWIDERAPITEQGKAFNGKIFITGGQGILNDNPGLLATPEKCFTIDSNGIISKYDDSCGEMVVIPASVNNVKVKKIATNAFRPEKDVTDFLLWQDLSSSVYDEKEDTTTGIKYYIIVKNDKAKSRIEEFFKKVSEEEASNNFFINNESELPATASETEEGKYGIIAKAENGEDEILLAQTPYKDSIFTIKGVDFSKAIYLEEIEPYAFTLYDGTTEAGLDKISANYNKKTANGKDNFDNSLDFGLTYINFGANDNAIKIGTGAFLFSKLDKLTVYNSLTGTIEKGYNSQSFGMSSINNLTIKPSKDNTVIDYKDKTVDDTTVGGAITSILSGQFALSYITTVNISEGITKISELSFPSVAIKNVNLPESLVEIGGNQFVFSDEDSENDFLLTSIVVPKNVKIIGEKAFAGAIEKDTIIMKRANLDGMTLGENWSSNATIKFEP